MMDDTYFQEWVVPGQQRELAQYPARLPHDQPHESQRDAEVEQVHRHFVGKMMYKNHLEKIQPVPEDQ